MTLLDEYKQLVDQRNREHAVLERKSKLLVAALKGLLHLKASTEETYEDAYYAMFESDGREYWLAAEMALAAWRKEKP